MRHTSCTTATPKRRGTPSPLGTPLPNSVSSSATVCQRTTLASVFEESYDRYAVQTWHKRYCTRRFARGSLAKNFTCDLRLETACVDGSSVTGEHYRNLANSPSAGGERRFKTQWCSFSESGMMACNYSCTTGEESSKRGGDLLPSSLWRGGGVEAFHV